MTSRRRASTCNAGSDLLIRRARRGDLRAIIELEVAAGQLFADIGMISPALAGPPDAAERQRQIDDQQTWVTVDDDDHPIAHLVMTSVDANAHLEQVSVAPAHARRGVGRALIEDAVVRAGSDGYQAMTLTTYDEVPWNGPYYERLGWRPMADAELTLGLRAIRDHEIALGLDEWPRVCMVRPFSCARS
jgi:predicted N-acetyltransferase YhbS